MSNTLRGGSKVYGVEIDSTTRGPKRNGFTLLNFREFSSLFLRERPRKSAMREWVEMNWDKLVLNYSEDSSSINFERYLGSYVSMDLLAEADRLSRETSTGVSPTQYNLRKNLMVQSGGMVRRSVLMRNLYLYLSYLFNRELYVSLMGKYPLSYFDENEQFGGGNNGENGVIPRTVSNTSNSIYNKNSNIVGYNNKGNENGMKRDNSVESPETVLMQVDETAPAPPAALALRRVHHRLLNEKVENDPKPRAIYLIGFELNNGYINEVVLKITGYDASIDWHEIESSLTTGQFSRVADTLYDDNSQFVYEGFMYNIFGNIAHNDRIVLDYVVRSLLSKENVIDYPVRDPLKIETDEVKFTLDCKKLLEEIVQKSDSNKIFMLFTSYKPGMIPLRKYLRGAWEYGMSKLEENRGQMPLLDRNIRFMVRKVYKEIFALLSYLFKKYKFIHGDLHGNNLLVRNIDFSILSNSDLVKTMEIPYIEFFDFDWSLFWGKTYSVLQNHIDFAVNAYDYNLVKNSIDLMNFDMSIILHLFDVGRLLFHCGLHDLILYLDNETMNIIFGRVPDNWRELMKNLIEKYKPLRTLGQITDIPYIMTDFAYQVGFIKLQEEQPQEEQPQEEQHQEDKSRKRLRSNRGNMNNNNNNNVKEPSRKR